MTFSEKDAFRSGVAQRIFEQIDRPSTDSNFARRIVGSPAMAEKLAAMFDKPADAKRFQAALLKETELFDKRKKLVKSGEANAARRFDGSISRASPSSTVVFRWRRRMLLSGWAISPGERAPVATW